MNSTGLFISAPEFIHSGFASSAGEVLVTLLKTISGFLPLP